MNLVANILFAVGALCFFIGTLINLWQAIAR